MAKGKFAIGIDFGTNSVRALVVDTGSGDEVATSVWNYAHGDAGIVLDSRDPQLARQHPEDYEEGIVKSVTGALRQFAKCKGAKASDIIGIGVDTTGSTPIPVDREGAPLAFIERPGPGRL